MILELLEKAVICEIIMPIKTKNGKLIEKINDFSLIVYPFIEGQNGFNCDLTQAQWIALGEVLQRVHALDIPLSIQHRLRYEKYSSKWRDIVRSFYGLLESECKGDEVALKLWTFMNAHLITISQLVDHAQELANILKHESFKLVLCHSDIHAGNILLGKNNRFYIVDWMSL